MRGKLGLYSVFNPDVVSYWAENYHFRIIQKSKTQRLHVNLMHCGLPLCKHIKMLQNCFCPQLTQWNLSRGKKKSYSLYYWVVQTMTSHFYSKKIGTAKFRIIVKQNKSFPQQPTTFLPCYTHGPKKQDNKGSAGFKTVYSNTGDSEGKESSCHAGDRGSGPGSGRSPEEGNGKPLQYSCPKNPMDRGAWRAIVM